jgi:septal ring factor EnvC (AmiA/AmiB activator)
MYSNLQAEARLAARRQARYEARNIRLKEIEKKQKEEEENAANQNSIYPGKRLQLSAACVWSAGSEQCEWIVKGSFVTRKARRKVGT